MIIYGCIAFSGSDSAGLPRLDTIPVAKNTIDLPVVCATKEELQKALSYLGLPYFVIEIKRRFWARPTMVGIVIVDDTPGGSNLKNAMGHWQHIANIEANKEAQALGLEEMDREWQRKQEWEE